MSLTHDAANVFTLTLFAGLARPQAEGIPDVAVIEQVGLP